MVSNIQEVKARGGRLIAIVTKGNPLMHGYRNSYGGDLNENDHFKYSSSGN